MTELRKCLTLAAWVLAPSLAAAEQVPPASGLSGEWILTTVVFGNERSDRLILQVEKGKATGSVYRRGKRIPLAGKVEGENVQFAFQEGDGKVSYTGRVAEGVLSGKATQTGGDAWGESPPADWRARRAAAASERPAAPRTLDFDRSSSIASSRARSRLSCGSGRETRCSPGRWTPAAWTNTRSRGSLEGTPRPDRSTSRARCPATCWWSGSRSSD